MPVESLISLAVEKDADLIVLENHHKCDRRGKKSTKTTPKAILLSIGLSSLLYIAVTLIAVTTISIESLANSDAPLALLSKEKSQSGTYLLGLVGLFAIINGVLIQMIMASRVMYGVGQKFKIVSLLSTAHPKTQTPILLTIITILTFSLYLPIATLAKLTSFIILIVFSFLI